MGSLSKIISGGQTGVDQAALRAARDAGLELGGWCPPGRVSEDGVTPAEFPLKETPHDRSPNAPEIPRSQRTEWNVRDSDATLVLQSATEKIQQWLVGRPISILNVAGPSEGTSPGIGERTDALLRRVFEDL